MASAASSPRIKTEVTILHFLEIGAGLVVNFYVFLRIYVDFHVHLIQVLDRVAFKLSLGPVFFEADCQETLLLASRQCTVLLSPVAQIVDRHGIPTIGFEKFLSEGTDDCASQVPGVERLGDIRRRILKLIRRTAKNIN
jgi:hypothetical protein